ncbi:MAG TPA: hypothetical protein VLT84_09730 [Acidobacteriota bacterium]|nr:hypothetical protein [Acidobacteriota bacterium]
MSLVSPDDVTVPLEILSRPQLCLAILGLAGKPLTTQGVIQMASEIGIDWQSVTGGPSNAVHGALWRERLKGNVTKRRNGPWELVDPTTAPRLNLKERTATLSPQRITPQAVAQKRRDTVLAVMGPGRMKPLEIMLAMRKIPEYSNMPRHAVREDLDALVADGKAERVGFGLYRKGATP